MSDKKGNNSTQDVPKNLQERLHYSRRIIRSLKAKADARRSRAEKIADWLTENFGSMPFLVINFLWFSIWIVINVGLIPGIKPFDPFPFGLLTTIVSLEAIGLAIIVLISQNRAAKIADLREEVDLQVDIITEEEITKLIQMVKLLLEKQGIDLSDDEDLPAMLKPTNVRKIETALEQQVVDQHKQS
jgi:uncharacterized membrane protein